MNAVLELQKLAHDIDGKGQEMEINQGSITWTPTLTQTLFSPVSIGCR